MTNTQPIIATKKSLNLSRLASAAAAAAIALAFSSCATLESGSTPAENAPKGYNANKTSSVTYNSEGIEDLVAARRNNAFKKMKEFCGGDQYEIIKETKEPYSEKNESLGNMFAAEVTRIEFRCR
jgi:hypothetical protein